MATPFWENTEGAFQEYFAQIADASAWDTAILGGRRVPGLVRVEAEPGRKIVVNTSPGSDGATIIDQGYEPAKPTISITIWTPAQWEALQVILAVVSPKPGKSAKTAPPAVPLVHPGANALGINAVLITGTTTLKHTGKGIHEMSLKCIQWIKNTRAVVKPFRAVGDSLGGHEAAPPALVSTSPAAKAP